MNETSKPLSRKLLEKSISASSLLLLVPLFSLAANPTAEPQEKKKCAIEGAVLVSPSGTPLPNAEVIVQKNDEI